MTLSPSDMALGETPVLSFTMPTDVTGLCDSAQPGADGGTVTAPIVHGESDRRRSADRASSDKRVR
jgi:hypothetical protein